MASTPPLIARPIQTGTAGWSVPRQHAEHFGTGSHLERYARVFSCAEINSSFYKPHRPATWARWAAAVPEGFRFSVKAPKTITHEARLACSPGLLTSFLEQASVLATKLGPLLFQLPPKLVFDPAVTHAFLNLLRDLHPGAVVFEPRHPSWFTPEADALFDRFHIARAAVDPTTIPDALKPGAWKQLVYYRLHGSPRIYYSAYTEEYLQSLATAIKRQRKTNPDADVWCIFDNTAAGAAFDDARTLQRLSAPVI